jgi:hypothetical protein
MKQKQKISQKGLKKMLVTIDNLSHCINEGNGYDVSSVTSLANNASLTLVGSVGSSEVHFSNYEISSNLGGYTFFFYEV